MRIGAIEDYSSYLQNYRVPEIPRVSVEEVKRQDQMKAREVQPVSEMTREEAPDLSYRKPNAEIDQLSLTFNKQESFDYLGKDSDINDLDMQKAISDMQKDQMLMQYQYFVGSAKNLFSNGDGTVIVK